MPFILALIAAGILAYFIALRTQSGAGHAAGLLDAAGDVRVAARRIGYHRRTDMHPVDNVEDGALCIAALACAFVEMDDQPTARARSAMDRSLRKHLHLDDATTQEHVLVGRWLVGQCGGPSPAFDRLAKRLKQLDSGPEFSRLMSVLGDVGAAGSKGMPSALQGDALGTLARIFRTA